MPRKPLPKKPLVEAILEVRWALQARPQTPIQVDPHFKLLLGRFYERARGRYPVHEQLPAATMPDELLAYTVQHRFRTTVNGFPLVQLGPGILTFNDTTGYDWDTFRPSAIEAVQMLFEAHPQPEELTVASLLLRYIDAVNFDYERDNLLEFLRDKMRVEVSLPQGVFDGNQIARKPREFLWQSSFATTTPTGALTLKFTTGRRMPPQNEPILVWETALESKGNELPALPSHFEEWFRPAHDRSSEVFWKLIEGDLEREFEGT